MASSERRLLSVKRLCAGRMMRREEFPEELFGDYAWTMLMLVYQAQLQGRRLAAANLYEDARVSEEVGKRWVAYAAQQNLLSVGDAITLTTSAADRLDRYIDRVIALASGQRPI